MFATLRFPGTHDCGAVGCDEVVGDVDDGPVGDELALSTPPHATAAAASTIDNTPARFIACTPSRARRSKVSALDASAKTRAGAMTMPRYSLVYICWSLNPLPS
jgi:hypothetical protein